MSFDASNKGNMKMYPFCVQYLSEIGVKKGIVDFIDDASESATNVHKNAREVLKKHHLNVQNLTTIGVDNTNVNVGEQHSVYKLFRDEFSDLIKGSCYNHILYNSVKQAHKLLTIDVEKILLSIYAHFSRSAKRIEELKTYYEFYEQDYLVILKHIKTRWLSLHTSIERILKVYNPIKDYFLAQDDCPNELIQFFSLEEGPCVLSFLEHILFIIQKTSLQLQRSYTTAVDLHRLITSLKFELQQRLDSSFFGSNCRSKLASLSKEKAVELKNSFVKFIQRTIE
ncbi:unnamed protein product [Didymodactylos carnosus]|uniref:Uncharacterized protein n=1 Tax=Didymodactylos carnosus TaxID=1234261 RepID=A0A8S2DUU2_9BILA|nr:unnamed protein product [Didymodactylos carnosus]CAF3824303.1 unnamed protein product [Didymodactylos carnosus]